MGDPKHERIADRLLRSCCCGYYRKLSVQSSISNHNRQTTESTTIGTFHIHPNDTPITKTDSLPSKCNNTSNSTATTTINMASLTSTAITTKINHTIFPLFELHEKYTQQSQRLYVILMKMNLNCLSQDVSQIISE